MRCLGSWRRKWTYSVLGKLRGYQLLSLHCEVAIDASSLSCSMMARICLICRSFSCTARSCPRFYLCNILHHIVFRATGIRSHRYSASRIPTCRYLLWFIDFVISDSLSKDMIRSMISLDPSKRLCAAEYRVKYKGSFLKLCGILYECELCIAGTAFPLEFYSHLYTYLFGFISKPVQTSSDEVIMRFVHR